LLVISYASFLVRSRLVENLVSRFSVPLRQRHCNGQRKDQEHQDDDDEIGDSNQEDAEVNILRHESPPVGKRRSGKLLGSVMNDIQPLLEALVP